jgi:hypothetical protein
MSYSGNFQTLAAANVRFLGVSDIERDQCRVFRDFRLWPRPMPLFQEVWTLSAINVQTFGISDVGCGQCRFSKKFGHWA